MTNLRPDVCSAGLFSTRGLLLPGARPLRQVLEHLNNPPVDLDLTGGFPLAGWRKPEPAETTYDLVRSIWTAVPNQSQLTDLATLARRPIDRGCHPIVAVETPRLLPTSLASSRAIHLVGGQLEALGAPVRMAVTLRANKLEGGRQHLAQLTTLRHMLEEWDLFVALDMDGPINIQWEAEAAIARLGDRLALVRTSAAAPTIGPSGERRLERRALRAALDLRPGVRIALVPSVHWWQALSPRAIARSWSDGARGLAALAPDRLDDFWVSPEQIDTRRESTPPA